MIETLPPDEQYTYVFDGNSQTLDHILVTSSGRTRLPGSTSSTSMRSSSTRLATTIRRWRASATWTAPSLEVSASPSELWPPNHKYRVVTATVTATDSVDPAPDVTLLSATSSEPDDAPGSG